MSSRTLVWNCSYGGIDDLGHFFFFFHHHHLLDCFIFATKRHLPFFFFRHFFVFLFVGIY